MRQPSAARRGASDSPRLEVVCPPIGPGGRWTVFSHALFYGTVTIAAATAFIGRPQNGGWTAAAWGIAAVLVAWYSYWIQGRGQDLVRSAALRVLYFGVVALLWTGLLAQDPAYELLSPTFFAQVLGYLRWRAAILAVASAFILVHVPPTVRTGSLGPEHVAFSLVGLGVFTLVILSLHAINEQNVRRQQLIESLEATRGELARMERHAGMLEERQRLAGEVHDTLAQSFASVVMLLEAAQAAAASGSKRAQEHMKQALQTARDGLGEARRVVWALRPESLEHGGLAAALERVTAKLARETGIVARTVVTGEARPLAPELDATLLRATQEAFANIRRHACARQATVTLSYMEDVVVVDVCDDGVGFDPARLPAAPGKDRGFGLVAMRERVEALHGSLTVESLPGRGSTLVVELPTSPRPPGERQGREDAG